MEKTKCYSGIDKDPTGAMNPTGNIIRDGWLFGMFPETETCEGWTLQGIDTLYDEVSLAWDKYGYQVSALPPDLLEKHQRIYTDAVDKAKAKGWSPELNDDD
ncbi:MAG: hypothetical protein KZQ82_02505 [Candidatus Thiodiazotropha sp. (ex Lucinoma annulata)]|nr:hypothetical protein [Candidatus Thiodiazotropha sp. (ex Lucinoma borealis)]MCU7854522.1 hypothetical protein [Candidatus Thiodiazotropha sp. (ex Lucinoma borealis)]MCU7870824.1 hypothetical protein [Candidatus Thiodiazotropha sp. (ex Lucinoma borealis)]MCU7883047.1 hypothetical protein [Candidatus Thiodiazotropha sp. (ex Lucinoma annulata)]